MLHTLSDKKLHLPLQDSTTGQQALATDLKTSTIHGVLSYNQLQWLKSYNDKKHNYKNLLVTSLKKAFLSSWTMKYLINLWKTFVKFSWSNAFYWGPNVHLQKTRIILDKPIYVGLNTIELSVVNVWLPLQHYDESI